jgi:hypothetical protein
MNFIQNYLFKWVVLVFTGVKGKCFIVIVYAEA